MNEQNPIKNTLEEMKKDLKSLLGIKRNKDSTTVSEKNSSSDIKKEIALKEEESHRMIEINKIEKQIISYKRNDNIIDLTLDENSQPNLNSSLENELNYNSEEKDKNKNFKDDNINFINQADRSGKKYFIDEEVQEKSNIQAQNTILNTHDFVENNNPINLEKNTLSEYLHKETPKAPEIFEIKDKKVVNNSDDINEIPSMKDNKLNQLDNRDIDFNKFQNNKIPENVVGQPKEEFFNQANDTTEKKDYKSNNTPNQTGFNIFSIENLSLPHRDKINEIFKAPPKNIFENLNMKNITFSGTKPSDKKEEEDKKKDLLEENKISKNNIEDQSKDSLIPNEPYKENNLGSKVESPKEKEKSIVNESSKAQIKGFSLDMVYGLENQKDQMLKLFTKQEDSQNPFGLGSSITNTNLFFTSNQFKNNLISSESNSKLMIPESINVIGQKIEEKVAIETIVSSKINENNEEHKQQEINPNYNQNTIPSENIHPVIPGSDIIQTPTPLSNKIGENTNKQALYDQNIVPMDVEKNPQNINAKEEHKSQETDKVELKPNNGVEVTQKFNASIEKKIILSSKIEQIINKKLEQTALNNDGEKTAGSTISQKISENVIENINNIENKNFINNQNEIEKDNIPNKVETGKMINLTYNLNNINTNRTKLNNNIPTGGIIENRDQQVINVEKKHITEEKTILQLVPINLTTDKKIEPESKKEPEINKNEKDNTENKEMKTQLILKPNTPEKPLESKPIEVDKKDSTVSVSSILKDAINPENESNKAESQIISGQNAPKQATAPEPGKKRAITFQEAKEQIDKFSDLISNLENEMRDKYGISIPQFYYEDLLPEPVKIKLVEEFFNDKEIVELNKQLHQKLEEKK